MAIKGKLKQKTGSNTSEILHPETDASVVVYSGSINETAVSDVKSALDALAAGTGVTGVKGDAESTYHKGDVSLSPANIGAVAANEAITAKTGAVKINYDAKGLVTGSSALAATDIPNLTLAKITDAGAAAAKGVATTISSSSTDNDLATAKAVYTAIENLPEPMIFKGTLGTNGTVTSLPTAASSNEGHTYKVIKDGTYASQSAKVGDVFVSSGTAWVLIPSGDDVEDTWRAIKVNGTQLLGNGISTGAVNLKNGGNITVSGSGNDVTLGVASGYSIPSTENQTAWSAKQDALDAQTAYSAKGTTTKVPQITTNALGQVTLIEEKSIAFPNITIGSSGSGNAITAIAVDSSNKHKINVTKGTTFLTASDITGKTDKATLTTKGDIYYASAPSTPARLGIGSEGQALTVGSSGVPVWANLPASFAVKNVEVNDVLTQQEYDDFAAGKLALLFYKEVGAEIPSVYVGTNSTLGALLGSVCQIDNLGYRSGNNQIRYTYWQAKVDTSSRTVTKVSASTQISDIYTSTPTSGSNKFFTAGGAYTELAKKADKVSMTAGTYSAVAVNSQGIVTAGGQVLEVIENGATPTVANGGWFFEKDA